MLTKFVFMPSAMPLNTYTLGPQGLALRTRGPVALTANVVLFLTPDLKIKNGFGTTYYDVVGIR